MAKLSDDDKERFISIRYLPTPVCQYFVLPPVQIAIYETQIMVANNQRHKASQRETKTKNKNSKPLECILGIINAYLFSFSVFQMQFFFACQIKTNKFIARDATTNEIAKCQPELATKLAFAIYTPKISICTRRRLCCIEGNVSSRNVADECNEHSGICSGSVNPLHCHDIILMALAKFQVLNEH